MQKPIYLDHHSTTPVDPRVLDEMMPYFKEKFGNPSSIDHIYGNEVAAAILDAKKQFQLLINASDSEEIIFTSGATESDNLVLFGIAKSLSEKGKHIITSKIEHKAILDTCKELESEGYTITYLSVNNKGQISLEELENAITPKTILVSIMAANNEIGSIQQLDEIGQITKSKNVLFHVDAAQAIGNILINVQDMNIDLLSASGHKMYGPKGVGVLYVRRGVKLIPQIYGGGQQRGLRSGTLNSPGIIGIGAAAKYAKLEFKKNHNHMKLLRDKLLNKLISSEPDIELNGGLDNRLPNNISIYIKDVEAKALINEVKDTIAISAGSACTSENVTPSHVILAIGYDKDRAYSTIRIGVGKFNADRDIDIAAEALIEAIRKLRNL